MTLQRAAMVAATVLGALVFTAVYLPPEAPAWLRWLRPDWAIAVLLYWTLVAPARLAAVWAWLLGLVVDVLLSDLLGLHAMTFAVVVFVASRHQQRLAQYPLLQQVGLVAAASAVAELIRMLLRALAYGADATPLLATLSLTITPLLTALAFALLMLVLPRQTKRFA